MTIKPFATNSSRENPLGDFDDSCIERCTKFGWYHFNDDICLEFYGKSTYFYKGDYLHRDGDKPSIIKGNHKRAWFKDGFSHRDCGASTIHIPPNALQTNCSYYLHDIRYKKNSYFLIIL